MSTASIVICGDFNDQSTSRVYAVLTKPSVASVAAATCIQLQSVYESCLTGEDLKQYYSTYKKRDVELCHVIDYIFVSGTITVKRLLSSPPLSSLPYRLPAPDYPSDHLALFADIAVHA